MKREWRFAPGGKRKARFGYPPGSRKARFFLNHLARVVFGELPPGGSFEAGDPALGGWSSSEADLAQNELKLPENQENESNLGSRFRPCGPKIGHKRGSLSDSGLFGDDSWENGLRFFDEVAVGEEAPVEVGELEGGEGREIDLRGKLGSGIRQDG